MKCITNPSVPTWLIITNDQGLITTALVAPNEEACTKDTNNIEEYTDEQKYKLKCDELGIEAIQLNPPRFE